MTITKAILELRIGECQRLKDEHLAQANAANGAIQALQRLIVFLDVPTPLPDAPAPTTKKQ